MEASHHSQGFTAYSFSQSSYGSTRNSFLSSNGKSFLGSSSKLSSRQSSSSVFTSTESSQKQQETRTTLPPANQNGALVTNGYNNHGNSQPSKREITGNPVPPQIRRDDVKREFDTNKPPRPTKSAPPKKDKGSEDEDEEEIEIPKLDFSSFDLPKNKRKSKHDKYAAFDKYLRAYNSLPTHVTMPPKSFKLPPLNENNRVSFQDYIDDKSSNQSDKENKKTSMNIDKGDGKSGKKFVASYTRNKPASKATNEEVKSKDQTKKDNDEVKLKENGTEKESGTKAESKDITRPHDQKHVGKTQDEKHLASEEQSSKPKPDHVSNVKKDKTKGTAVTGSQEKGVASSNKNDASDKSKMGQKVKQSTSQNQQSKVKSNDRDISPLSRTTNDTGIGSQPSNESDNNDIQPLKRKAGIKTESESGRTTGSSYVPKPKTKRIYGLASKNKAMYSRDKKKAELGTLTPRKERSTIGQTHKRRPHSFGLETERSIYRADTRLSDSNPRELTHNPATNTDTDLMMTYTGEYNMREALRSSRGKPHRVESEEDNKGFTVFKTRSKIPPWYEREYILNRRQAQTYQNMKNAYVSSNPNKRREKQFLKKLQGFQEQVSQQEAELQRERERKRREDKQRQTQQLKELRQRFEDEAWHRFHTQYVTSRVLEHEKLNRFEYGLPEEPGGKTEYAAKLRRKPKKRLSKKEIENINKKKYAVLFKKTGGPSWSKSDKDPKMEGIDTVILKVENEQEEQRDTPIHIGKMVQKKANVEDVIKDAKNQTTKIPEETPSDGSRPKGGRSTPAYILDSDDDDDDDDMSDIFERARRKYNLEVET